MKTAWLGEQKQQAWQKAYTGDARQVHRAAACSRRPGAAPAPVPPPKKQVPAPSGEGPLLSCHACPFCVDHACSADCRFDCLSPRGAPCLPRNQRDRARSIHRAVAYAGTRGNAPAVVLKLPDDVKNLREPNVQELADSLVERRWIDAGPNGLAGKRIEFPGLQITITDVLVRVEMLDGRKWTTIVHPSQPWVEITAAQTRMQVMGTYIVQGIRHILFGADHMLFVLGLLLIVKDRWMLLKTVTAFTVAHSITLAIATLGYAEVPVLPLNAAIALSILFLGPEIVRSWRGETSFTIRHPWVVAFAFGLLARLRFRQRADQRRTCPG